MGVRKKNRAMDVKEDKKTLYYAKLNDCPTSPRKMRLVADLIRNVDVDRALNILKLNPKEASVKVRKLLLSAIANWQNKNEGVRIEDSNLYVKLVSVDGGRSLKRLRTAPQGRGYRIRKRSNHVTIVLDSRVNNVEVENVEVE
ncbi:MAG: 50S ribosomal protein L22 [Bacteroidota bacterium]|nr:50S ribosomal protein L22 [Bacteroidota bacterium]